MSTLLLRLSAPLQAWGADNSKFEIRRTLKYPTKSGVIGLLASALGYSRDSSLEQLTSLKFGFRVDNQGEIIIDYHTAKSKDDSYTTIRYYLSDATFIVGLENYDNEFLKKLEIALKNPVYPLFLGRRSCPTTLPLTLGIRNTSLLDSLQNEKAWSKNEYLPIFIDTNFSEIENMDMPISFSKTHRKFLPHFIKECGYVENLHDPFSELEE